MRPALGIDINKKIQLKLSEDAGAESYTCLVKKVKENLVALVISNKDKSKVNPPVGEKLFLLNEWDGDYWITPVTLIQNQSFPLVILKVVEEPYSVIGGVKAPPPAPFEEIDSIVDDYSAADNDLNTPVDVSEEPVIVPASPTALEDVPPAQAYEKRWSQEKETEATDDVDPQENGLGIDENVTEKLEDLENVSINLETDETYPEEPLMVDDDDSQIVEDEILDESADVESAKIEDINDDILGDLNDMDIVPDNSIDISDLSVDGEESAESYPDDDRQETPSDMPDEIELVAVERSGDDEAREPKGGFNDNFVIFLTPIDREMAEGVMESIKSTGEKPSGEMEGEKEYAIDLPEGLDPSAKKIMETLSSHILNIEKTMEELKKNVSSPFFSPLGEQISAICVSLGNEGMGAILDNTPPEGSNYLISVERPWKPALKFTATAIVDSIENIHGVDVAKMSFTAIHSQGIASINNYLTHGAEYFELLDKLHRE